MLTKEEAKNLKNAIQHNNLSISQMNDCIDWLTEKSTRKVQVDDIYMDLSGAVHQIVKVHDESADFPLESQVTIFTSGGQHFRGRDFNLDLTKRYKLVEIEE